MFLAVSNGHTQSVAVTTSMAVLLILADTLAIDCTTLTRTGKKCRPLFMGGFTIGGKYQEVPALVSLEN